MKPFAEVTFRASRADHRAILVHVRVDAPRRARTGEWACNVIATGFVKRTAIRGEDALQALCLALDFLSNRLYDARRRGVRFRFLTGDEVPLFAYFRLRESRRRLAVTARKHAVGQRRGKKRRRLTSA
jgi:hypothetical protein